MTKLFLTAAAAVMLAIYFHPTWRAADILAAPPAAARQARPAAAAVSDSSPQSELHAVTEHMKALLGEGKRVAARLAREINARPHEADRLVRDTAAKLSVMADQTTSTGNVIKEVTAIRAKALAYRQAVMAMRAGAMSEVDRQRVLEAWNHVIKTANTAQAAVADIHTTLLAELRDLRMREVAVGQLMLAGEYQAALDDVLSWTKELKATMEKLNALVSGPMS